MRRNAGDLRDATRCEEMTRRVTRNLGFKLPGGVDSSSYLSPRPSYAPETTAAPISGQSGAHATCSRGRRHRTRHPCSVERQDERRALRSLTYSSIFYGFGKRSSSNLGISSDSVSNRKSVSRRSEKFDVGQDEVILSSIARNCGSGTFEREGTWRSGRSLPLKILWVLRTRCASLICLRDSSPDSTRLFEWTRVVLSP